MKGEGGKHATPMRQINFKETAVSYGHIHTHTDRGRQKHTPSALLTWIDMWRLLLLLLLLLVPLLPLLLLLMPLCGRVSGARTPSRS